MRVDHRKSTFPREMNRWYESIIRMKFSSPMLEQVQILRENGDARFAVIPFDEYVALKELLADEEKLTDYLDYLHAQNVKAQGATRHTLAEVKAVLDID